MIASRKRRQFTLTNQPVVNLDFVLLGINFGRADDEFIIGRRLLDTRASQTLRVGFQFFSVPSKDTRPKNK